MSYFSLLRYVESDVMNIFSELHEYVGMNADITDDVISDRIVDFVSQRPITIYQEATMSLSSTTNATGSISYR